MATAPAIPDFIALLPLQWTCANHVRHGFRLRTHEVCEEVASEQCVGLCAGKRFLYVVLMLAGWAIESDERSGEVHLWVVAAKLHGFLDQRIAVESLGGIRFVLTHPLPVAFREIAQVE